MSSVECYDVIVIGAGIIGSSTGYSLRKNNVKTLILEQYPLPHSRGSSHGQTRIIRKAYIKPYYSEMMDDAYQRWETLEREEGVQIYRKTGCLYLAPTNDSPYLADTKKALERCGVEYSTLDGAALKQRFPQFQLDNNAMALIEEDSGSLKADKALRAFQNQYKKLGGTLLDGTKVINIQPGTMSRVTTINGAGVQQTFDAKKLIITTGSWANDLLKPLGVTLHAKPLRITATYWQEDQHNLQKRPHASAGDGMPCFIVFGDPHILLYGLPSDEYPGQVKIAVHEGPVVHPDQRDLNPELDGKFLNDLKLWTRKHLPNLGHEPAVLEKCIYTMTPDEDFFLDTLPKWSNIIVATGFSGHGFKKSPVIGAMLADLAVDKKPHYDMSHYKINRFKDKAKL